MLQALASTQRPTHHVELLLQLLVGVVDAELLKPVCLEHLEAIDVQDTNEQVLGRVTPEGSVDAPHHPLEQTGVQLLR